MSRVKRGVIKNKRRKNVLKQTKGYRHGRGSKEAQAKEAIFHAGTYAFAHRKDKKSDARKLWNVKISSASKAEGLSYSKMIGAMKKKNILLDRKILASLAEHYPATFKRLLKEIA